MHPRDWQAEWLIEKTNAELRRVLIEGIGYTRIMEELDAIEIDSYNEYSLIEVINNIDIELIHLLEMTCLSKEKIHVLCVPLNLESAREAIEWVNRDVAPEKFAIQT